MVERLEASFIVVVMGIPPSPVVRDA